MHGLLAAHASQPPVLRADWLLVEKKGETTLIYFHFFSKMKIKKKLM